MWDGVGLVHRAFLGHMQNVAQVLGTVSGNVGLCMQNVGQCSATLPNVRYRAALAGFGQCGTVWDCVCRMWGSVELHCQM